MLRTRIIIAALGVFALGTSTNLASAQTPAEAHEATSDPREPREPSEEELKAARQIFFDAVAAEDAGRYEDALALYERVARVTISPTLLFNVATCREKLGHLLQAEAAYERALTEATKRADEEVAAESRARVAALREAIPHIVVVLPKDAGDATATLDDEPIATAALADLRVDPGAHRLVVRSERHLRVFAVGLELPPRSTRVVEADLGSERGPEPSRPVIAAPKRHNWTPAIVSGGAAALFGAGALVTWLDGHAKSRRYETLNATPTTDNHDEREGLRSSLEGLSVLNAICIATTAAAVGAGVYFLVRPPVARGASATKRGLPFVSPFSF